MPDPRFDGLPRPLSGHLTAYVLGPGYGESQVVVLPNGATLVVDSCCDRGANLPRALLDWLGIRTIDLLVLTHPDLDHISGLPELVTGLTIGAMWRFRGASRITDLAAYWLRGNPGDTRLQELHRALTCMEELEEESPDGGWRVDGAARPWRFDDCDVRCLAPTQYDQLQLERHLRRIVLTETGELDSRMRSYLLGERRTLGESGNPLSLALVVAWRDARLLLAGDVEVGDGHPRSGWRGVLWELDQTSDSHLLSGLVAVKTPHHGSDGAFLAEAWQKHASTGKVRISVVAPFNRGSSPPPHSATLQNLRAYSDRLAITADLAGDAGDRARAAGWIAMPIVGSAAAPCVALVVDESGACAVSLGLPGSQFQ